MLSLNHITTPIVLAKERPAYANDLLSVSRLNRYEQCPKSFEMRYVRRLKSEPGLPLVFGNLIHDTLEATMNHVVEEQMCGPFPKEFMLEAYRGKFEDSPSITEFEVFEEGRHILVDFAARNGIVDASKIRGIEQRFELPIGDWNFLGFMDRVDEPEPGWINVRDYKTNRVLFDREKVDSDLQASIYLYAARQLWPDAERITFTFDMLRHGVDLHTERDAEAIESAVEFVKSLARQSEMGNYPAKLNEFCAWCDVRNGCDEYQKALKTDDEALADLFIANPDIIEEVAKERERVSYIFKLLKGRKEELEKIIKARIKVDGGVVADGIRYSINKAKNGRKFDRDKTIERLVNKGFGTAEELREKLMIIDPAKLDAFVKAKAKELSPADAKMLRVEIDAMAQVKWSSRFSARKDTGK